MIKTGLTATFIAGLIMSAIAIWAMNALPTTGDIPIHWNIKGEADGFASPAEARRFVWLIPGISIFVGLVLAVGAKIDPRQDNIHKSRRAYLAVWIGTMALMVFITALICLSMVRGTHAPDARMDMIPSFIVGSISLLTLILGNYLPKTRSNWFFGIRTPWTLSSEVAWIKTHRLAGRLFMAMGVAGLLSVIFAPLTWQLTLMVGGPLIIAVFCLVYSYKVWRDAPDQLTPSDYVE